MTAEPDKPVTTYSEAIGAIRERVGTVLKIQYRDFDSLCCWSDGLAGKVFGPAQVKRLGIEKFFDALRGAGLRIRFEEDPEQTAKMLERVAKNYEPRQANQARMNNRSHLSNALINEVLGYLANHNGGLTVLNKAVKQARSNTARRASKAFWEKKRKCTSDLSTRCENVSMIRNAMAQLPPPPPPAVMPVLGQAA